MTVYPSWFNWKENLWCPTCQGDLALTLNQFECQVCHVVYEIKDGIPYFVDLGNLGEFEGGESEFHTHIASQADKAHGQTTLRAEYLHNGFLAPILALPPGVMVLDVACGSGVDLIRLAKQGYHIVGVDIAPGMVMTTRQKAIEQGVADRVFLCVANARQLPFRQQRFQAVYICAALHHMQSPQVVLSELARVTQAGGFVSIGSEPNAWIYKFRSLKHSVYGRRLLRIFRNDYTIGDQPPGDKGTPGWRLQDWPQIIVDTGLKLVKVEPIWYFNGVASLLGLHRLPRWLEAGLCWLDEGLTRVPVIKNYSIKWNVITQKEGPTG